MLTQQISGCITSAETVLINMQSTSEILSVLKQNELATEKKLLVASIAPQCVASMAAFHKISPISMRRKLKTFVQSFGFETLIDTSIAREISLVQSAREFESRWKSSQNQLDHPHLPLLSSACPGWICYVEKTHHPIIPYLSNTRSPQQILGYLLKRSLSRGRNMPSSRIYHVAIMPCFDKKLEASRSDFTEPDTESRDVDCVITTRELQQLAEEFNIVLTSLPEADLAIDELGPKHVGSSSGGYLQYVMASAAINLFGCDDPDRQVKVKTVRNSDMREYILEDASTQTPLLRMATCYGFRNIQNLVRKLEKKDTGSVKRKKQDNNTAYDYVEVMACPSGCINGGGQLKPLVEPSEEKTLTPKEWLEHVEQTYQLDDGIYATQSRAQEILHRWGLTDTSTDWCRTEYHAVEATFADPLAQASSW